MTRNRDEQQRDVKTIDDVRTKRGAYSPVWLAVPAGAVAACTLAADLPPVVTLALVLGAMVGVAILQALQVLQPILFNTAVHHQRRLDRRQIYRMRDASRRSAVFIHDDRGIPETSDVVITTKCGPGTTGRRGHEVDLVISGEHLLVVGEAKAYIPARHGTGGVEQL
jgi:hypothetical protein